MIPIFQKFKRRRQAGMTTVELLIVIGIIGITLSIAIPFMARIGLITTQKAELAARDLYMMLRAARVYASTHNVDAALAYAGSFRTDSLSNQQVPVVDAYALVRKIRREDPDFAFLNQGLQIPADVILKNVFVPVRSQEGSFTPMERGMCILPDIFAFQTFGCPHSLAGLDGIHIWDPDAQVFLEPRANYEANVGSDPQPYFPAHRFRPSGEVQGHSCNTLQRVRLRVGHLPDAPPEDRFYADPQPGTEQVINIRFSGPVTQTALYPNPEGTDEAEVDVEIFLYMATGRVKIES